MVILETWIDLRNRLLASPAFRRWAARFPLTRPLARRRARALFDIVAGFVYSQVLFACVRLRLFEHLAAGAQPLETLAPRLGLPPEGARRLLRAAATLRLVQNCGPERYAIGDLGAAVLNNPGIAAMVEHHALVYRDLEDPIALLRGQTKGAGLSQYWAYASAEHPADADERSIDAYTALMSNSQSLIASEVLDAYPFRNHRCLLDVGGGDGTFLTAVAQRWPQLQVILFDLPAVAERARARFARAGLTGRATAVGGDVQRDPLPVGADVVALVRVLHDHDDESVRGILNAAWRALPPGGTLLIAEPLAETPGAEPIGDAYFGFYLLAMGQGRPRTASELEEMLRAARFEAVRLVGTAHPMLTRLLVARRRS